MPRRRSTRSPEAPLVRPRRPRTADATAIALRLRELHEEASDPRVETMPAPDELWGLLSYCEASAPALRGNPAVEQEAALLCVQLVEHLLQQLPVVQGRATQRARAAGAPWEQFIGPYGVGSISAAYSRGARLVSAVLETQGLGPIRRTPEAARAAEQQMAVADRARRRRQMDAETRPAELRQAAEAVLKALDDAEDFPRDDAGMVDFFAEHLAYVLADDKAAPGALLTTLTALSRVVTPPNGRELSEASQRGIAALRTALQKADNRR